MTDLNRIDLVAVLRQLDASMRRLYPACAHVDCDDVEGAFGELIGQLSKMGVITSGDADSLMDVGDGLETGGDAS